MTSCCTKFKLCFIDSLLGCCGGKKKDTETLPVLEGEDKGFFGLEALDIDGTMINFENDLKGKFQAFLVVNVASA